MLRVIAILLFKLGGWKLVGQMSPTIRKCVLVAAPHTSNMDFIFAMACFYQMKIPIKYLIKKEWADFFLFRKMFKKSGALGVNRSTNCTMVETLAKIIQSSNDDLVLMISPEGTRKLSCNWKTGFYYTALKAKVPIVLSHLDYATKTAAIGPSFVPTGAFKSDMVLLKEYYKNIVPRYPEKFSLDIYQDEDLETEVV